MTSEIQQYVERLRLSSGDLLCLAREIAEDAKLRSVEQLTEHQRRNLIDLLAFLATPAEIRCYQRGCATA